MTVEQFEAKLTRNPRSPLFVSLAEEFLRARRVDEALKLCTERLKYFPDYATAHFVAAQCFAERNDFQLALQHIEHAIGTLPDNALLVDLRNDWQEKSRILHEQVSEGKNALRNELPLDELASKLKSVERIPSKSDTVPPHHEVSAEEPVLDDTPIVSVTLAEIYAMQGAYEAAIAMYRKLQQQKPDQTNQFEAKIRELKEKLRQRTSTDP